MHDAGRVVGQPCDGAAVHTASSKALQCFVAARVRAHGADHQRVSAEPCRVHGHVRGRATEVLAVGEDVPQHLARAGDYRPRRRWISSNGTPLVSGTIVSTQTSCSVIMPQKNRKMVPGWKALTMRGNIVVSSAANTQ